MFFASNCSILPLSVPRKTACKYTCKRKQRMDVHTDMHKEQLAMGYEEENGVFSCKMCATKCKTWRGLKYHLQKSHEKRQERSRCEKCLSFECYICHMKQATRIHLKAHMAAHTVGYLQRIPFDYKGSTNNYSRTRKH